MATSTKVSLEDYFRTHFEGECELVNGELRPKPMGTKDHSRVQGRVYSALLRYEQAGHGDALVELSLRLGETILIPDVAFTRPDQSPDQYNVFDTPPFLCVEVISPSQSFGELYNKCLGYLHWGVAHCWIIDPVKRTAWEIGEDEAPLQVSAGGLLRAGEIEVKLGELWS
jgi:Uma2 family endonuclease